MTYTIVLTFRATNNKVDYEALVMRLRLVRGMDILSLTVRCDYELTINQEKGEYATKRENMKKYLLIKKRAY